MFKDRADAGRRLAELLKRWRGQNPVVLALPRGGVPVAAEIVRAIGGELSLLVIRKIGSPHQPELAIGAVVDINGGSVVLNDEIVAALGVDEAFIKAESQRQLAEARRRKALFMGQRQMPDLRGRIVIVVDDGIATGATVRAGLRALRDAGAGHLVLAVPIAPREIVNLLREAVDEVVVLEAPERFSSVGAFYEDFQQVEDAEVLAILAAVAGPADRDGPQDDSQIS